MRKQWAQKLSTFYAHKHGCYVLNKHIKVSIPLLYRKAPHPQLPTLPRQETSRDIIGKGCWLYSLLR